MSEKKVLLIILDGWGIAKSDELNGSAIHNSGELYFNELMSKYPNSTLITYGEDVGLPKGQMGNSEVGHMNIGAGRIVYQDLNRINNAMLDGTFIQNKKFQELISYCIEKNKPLHLMGLYSNGGVHSYHEHFHHIINFVEQAGIKEIYLHLFTDGRDCDPKSSINQISDLKKFLIDKNTKIASVSGRYYAMDRDNRWDRIKIFIDMLTIGQNTKVEDPITEIENRYKINQTDEFIIPFITKDFKKIENDDAVFCLNFRTDRCRELTIALTQRKVAEIDNTPLQLHYTTMTNYSNEFKNLNYIFDKEYHLNTLAEILSKNNKQQLRIAETEKYAHVTFFFSVGKEESYNLEERILVNSPKVATYDIIPEMSAFEINNNLIKELKNSKYDFIVVNFANADMVGHTGNMLAAIKAIQAVDSCLKKSIEEAINNGYDIIITADHGNSDYLINNDGTPNTAHSTNLVPFICISKKVNKLQNGKLADIAPTILKLLDIPIPKEMNGNVLF